MNNLQHTRLQIPLDVNTSIVLATRLLTNLIDEQGTSCISIFNSSDKPLITLDAYLTRLHKYTGFSPSCLIIALIYIDRYNMNEPEFSINEWNVHKLLLSCLLLAVKFNDDIYYDNVAFEKGGGVGLSELMSMELQIFQKMSFNGFVGEEEYTGLLSKLKEVYIDEQ